MSDPNPTAAVMQTQLADLRQQIASLHTIQATGRRWTLVTVVLVVLLFALFTWATYTRIKRNFNDQAVQEAVGKHGDEVNTMASDMLVATGKDVWPAYKDAAVLTLRRDGPAAATTAVEHLRAIPQKSGEQFKAQIDAAFAAAVKRVEPDFRAAFPAVPDQRRQDLLKAFVADQIESQNKRIAVRVDQLYTNDRIRMQTTLEKFDSPRVSAMGPDGLERQFLHTMVALLDDQVDAAFPAPDAAPPAPTARTARTASAKIPPTTGPTTGPAATQPTVP